MKRRTFLAGLGAFTVTLGGGVAVWSRFPVIPQRPEPDLETAGQLRRRFDQVVIGKSQAEKYFFGNPRIVFMTDGQAETRFVQRCVFRKLELLLQVADPVVFRLRY